MRAERRLDDRIIRAIDFSLILIVFVLVKVLLIYYWISGVMPHGSYPGDEQGRDAGSSEDHS